MSCPGVSCLLGGNVQRGSIFQVSGAEEFKRAEIEKNSGGGALFRAVLLHDQV